MGRIMCMALLSTRELAVGSERDIKVFEIDSGKLLKNLTAHSALVRDILLLDNSRTLVSTSDDKTIKIWDVETLCNTMTLKGHNHSTNKVLLYKPDVLVSASDDATIKFWCMKSGQCIRTLEGHTSWVI